MAQVKLVWSAGRFPRQFRQAQRLLDQSVLRDASPFVPRKTGRLVKSGQAAPGGGSVTWSAPYAAPVYYRKKTKGSRPDSNPRWFEAAKARYARDWIRDVKKQAGGA